MAPVAKPEDYNISEDSLRIAGMLDALLDRVEGVYEANGVPLPTRRYWMLGADAPEDCEQVVVTFVQGELGIPGDPNGSSYMCSEPKSATITVSVTRDHPIGTSGRPINPDKIIESSTWGAIDAATLLFNLEDIVTPPDWGRFPNISSVLVSPPNGGVQTTTLTIRMVIP